MARRPADLNRTFGSHRAEIIGALLNGVFLAGMAVLVLIMGAMRLRHPIDLPATPLLVAAGGGLFTEFIAIRLLYSGQKGDLNLRGAFWHVMQTFIGSILILVTAAVIYFTGFLAIDPILGMAFGLVLLAASWGIIRDSLSILMEGAPKGIDLIEVAEALDKLPGARNIHHLHAWDPHIRQDRFFGAYFDRQQRTSRFTAGRGASLAARSVRLLFFDSSNRNYLLG
jgi:cobalt-zinc-cadmium efflux system protein